MCFRPPQNDIPSGSSSVSLLSPEPSSCFGVLLRFDEIFVELSVEDTLEAVNVHSYPQYDIYNTLFGAMYILYITMYCA